MAHDIYVPASLPRRASSSPNLREGLHVTSHGRIAHNPNDTPEIFLRPDSLTPATALPRLQTANYVYKQNEINEHPSDTDKDPGPPRIESPAVDPPPTWDEYPPMPGGVDGGPFSFGYWWSKIKAALGYGGPRERREIIRLIWKLSFDAIQIILSIVFTVISGKSLSPVQPDISEWTACNKPLGAWACVWIVRIAIGSSMSIWAWQRQKLARSLRPNAPRNNAGVSDVERVITSVPRTDTRGSTDDITELQVNTATQGTTNSAAPRLPHTALFSRISMFISLFSMSWWLAAQALLYASIHTCRHSSPHLWWLVFGLICVGYIVVVEVFLVALLVFILGPMLLLIVNSVLLCLGRQPVQPPTRIHPEIGKLPKETVARIPLVLYIPSPPNSKHGVSSEVPIPQSHSYPPLTQNADVSVERDIEQLDSSSLTQSRFMQWITKNRSRQESKRTTRISRRSRSLDRWEEQWQRGLYPFVRLSGSRATCHICLEEFEEPKKQQETLESIESNQPRRPVQSHSHYIKRSKAKDKADKATNSDTLKLEDAGDGAQPLRLLACGHVFHRTCIDPWLIDVSGRCPVCQRAVELDGSRIPVTGRRR